MSSKPLRQLVFSPCAEDVNDALATYGADIHRMKVCLEKAGFEASEQDLAAAWLAFSEGSAVKWIVPPSSDHRLLAILLEARAPLLIGASSLRQQWKASLVDADDGSGDQILNLPDDLLMELGWSIGDSLEVSRLSTGDVRLHKVVDVQ